MTFHNTFWMHFFGAGIAAAVCAGFIILMKPLLIRYALARPNARSSHTIPTPQGGGIAVLLACFLVYSLFYAFNTSTQNILPVLSWAVPLAILGGIDDIRPLPAWLRFIVQIFICGCVIYMSTDETSRIFPGFIPLQIEQLFLTFCAVWFVNLVNFMDGLDWITVAEFIPVLLALVFLLNQSADFQQALFAACLLGSLLGFAWFNKPVARLFLGDVGSLPIGLLAGYLLLQLALAGYLVAALLLPLYYLCDATITLVRRFLEGKKVWQAHREHFYQQATDNGFSVLQVVSHIFLLNSLLAFLALLTLHLSSLLAHIFVLSMGFLCVGYVIKRFSTPLNVL